MSPLLKGIVASSKLTAVATSYESIATQIATSSTGSFTFSNIPQTFKHLQLRVVAKTTDTQSGDFVSMRFNGDATNTYGLHGQFTATGSSNVTSFYNGAYAQMILERITTSGSMFSSQPNTFGALIVDITDYTNTNKRKVVKHMGGFSADSVYGDVRVQSNFWNDTSAITSILVAPSNIGGWNFTTGTKFALYGIKG